MDGGSKLSPVTQYVRAAADPIQRPAVWLVSLPSVFVSHWAVTDRGERTVGSVGRCHAPGFAGIFGG